MITFSPRVTSIPPNLCHCYRWQRSTTLLTASCTMNQPFHFYCNTGFAIQPPFFSYCSSFYSVARDSWVTSYTLIVLISRRALLRFRSQDPNPPAVHQCAYSTNAPSIYVSTAILKILCIWRSSWSMIGVSILCCSSYLRAQPCDGEYEYSP